MQTRLARALQQRLLFVPSHFPYCARVFFTQAEGGGGGCCRNHCALSAFRVASWIMATRDFYFNTVLSLARPWQRTDQRPERRYDTTRGLMLHRILQSYCDALYATGVTGCNATTATEHCVVLGSAFFGWPLQSYFGNLKYITWHCMIAIFIYTMIFFLFQSEFLAQCHLLEKQIGLNVVFWKMHQNDWVWIKKSVNGLRKIILFSLWIKWLFNVELWIFWPPLTIIYLLVFMQCYFSIFEILL